MKVASVYINDLCVTCPHCGYFSTTSIIGKVKKCGKCGEKYLVPKVKLIQEISR